MISDSKNKIISAEEISPEAGVGEVSRPRRQEVLQILANATYPANPEELAMHARRLDASNEVLHAISMLIDRKYKDAADVEANLLAEWFAKK